MILKTSSSLLQWALFLVLMGFLGACSTVEFHEQGRLQDPLMEFTDSAAETHFYQKVFYSREGSVGGFGSSAGGGCGCY